jgi:hypothetical protein
VAVLDIAVDSHMKPTSYLSISARVRGYLIDRETARFRLPLALVLIAYTIMHFLAAYNLPTPWPDEAHFMWQANGIAEHLTLFAPELNGGRTICWMPPGYFVVLGIIFKVFGLSLGVARTFSLLTSLTAIVLLVYLAKQLAGASVVAFISIPFMLGEPFVAGGNVARMDSLLLALVVVSFLLLSQGKLVVGLCLLALTPLIHPNGIPFLVAGLFALPLFWDRPVSWRRPTAMGIAAVVFLLLAWLAYAVFISVHWADFRHDLAYQMSRKTQRDLMSIILAQSSVYLTLFAVIGAVYALRRNLRVTLLLALAVPAWWIAAAGGEMWYRNLFAVSFFCLSVFFCAVCADLYRLFGNRWTGILVAGSVGLLAFSLIAWNVKTGPVDEALVFPDLRPWHGLYYRPRPYITDDEVRAIESRLASLIAGRDSTRIGFYPEGDAFFYSRLRSSHVLFNCPLFSSQKADWDVVHLSPRIPGAVHQITLDRLRDLGFSREDIWKFPLLRRDSTEAWFLVPVTP